MEVRSSAGDGRCTGENKGSPVNTDADTVGTGHSTAGNRKAAAVKRNSRATGGVLVLNGAAVQAGGTLDVNGRSAVIAGDLAGTGAVADIQGLAGFHVDHVGVPGGRDRVPVQAEVDRAGRLIYSRQGNV